MLLQLINLYKVIHSMEAKVLGQETESAVETVLQRGSMPVL